MRRFVRYCRVCRFDVDTQHGFCPNCGENLINPKVKKEMLDEFEEDSDETVKQDLDAEDDIK